LKSLLSKGDHRPQLTSLSQVVDDFSSQFDENPMQVVETIDASHRDMVRFRSHLDHGYRQVVGVLRKHISLLAPIHDAERVCQ
jgi:hypothetical protein